MNDPFRWRLRRSLVLWGGMVVMISLLWMWWDSTRNFVVTSYGHIGVISGGSGLSVGRSSTWPAGFTFRGDSLTAGAESLSEVGLRRPIFMRHRGDHFQDESLREAGLVSDDPVMPLFIPVLAGGKGDWNLYLPYWLLVVGVAVPWGGWLAWRGRRVRRVDALVEEGGAG